MDATEMGPIFNEIGQLLVDSLRRVSDGGFLYAKVEPGVVAVSAYLDTENAVLYRDPVFEIDGKTAEAWEAVDPTKRWRAMSYSISGDRFSVQFQYPEELDLNEHFEDRRERILKERYGNKPIDYSDPGPLSQL